MNASGVHARSSPAILSSLEGMAMAYSICDEALGPALLAERCCPGAAARDDVAAREAAVRAGAVARGTERARSRDGCGARRVREGPDKRRRDTRARAGGHGARACGRWPRGPDAWARGQTRRSAALARAGARAHRHPQVRARAEGVAEAGRDAAGSLLRPGDGPVPRGGLPARA